MEVADMLRKFVVNPLPAQEEMEPDATMPSGPPMDGNRSLLASLRHGRSGIYQSPVNLGLPLKAKILGRNSASSQIGSGLMVGRANFTTSSNGKLTRDLARDSELVVRRTPGPVWVAKERSDTRPGP